MSTKTFKVDDHWVVSSHQCWVEGVYTTEDAARKAPTVDVDALHKLWGRMCPEPITEEQLDAFLQQEDKSVEAAAGLRKCVEDTRNERKA